MASTTEFGKTIEKKLIDLERPQNWLIEQVRAQTGLYFDSSYLYKIKTGKLATPKIVRAIREILGLEEA
ncbi:MAG TPA: XRE family transcriptional regulator [Candidatus Flavonifractor intestinipullorum]|uniref:XRE family transcriptional regulator n=1 Tax=Candidatus Flavonifractor intestinipullorum TaxID=2838587 RepID=A0A9D2MC62_9FIRM|nr:XRE family transcriptional regulator [Candidatus Flavonifractor intestinipullorum]